MVRDEETALQRVRGDARATLARYARDWVVLAVGVVALFALVLRLVALGDRPAHWDEGRVAYWALRYEQTGAFAYDHIVHGPLIQHADRWLFALVGPSDFTARLPVALVGSVLPLSALLFRDHLRDAETVALALLLATNTAVLYYSRFMRSDVLVATFMLFTLGFLLRLYDTRKRRYLYAAAVTLALGVASKENAVLYAATWLGALALVIDTRLFRPSVADTGTEAIRATARRGFERIGEARAVARYYLPHVVGALVLLAVLLLFLFAPRGAFVQHRTVSAGELGTVSLWEGVTQPAEFPSMVWDTATYTYDEYTAWTETAGGGDEGGIFQKFDSFGPQWVDLLAYHLGGLLVLSVGGFLYERYATAERRTLVQFFTYAGVASIVGYPLAMDIFGAWNAVHVAVPLSVPAAVAVGTLVRWWQAARAERDLLGVTLAVLVLVSGAAAIAVPAYGNVYVSPDSDDNDLVQYGQPSNDLRGALTDVEGVVAANEGTDLLVFGSEFVGDGQSSLYLPGCLGRSGWFDSLPLPWYYGAMDAEVECVASSEELNAGAGLPPVIVTHASNTDAFGDRLDEYDVSIHRIRTSDTPVAFLVRSDAPR